MWGLGVLEGEARVWLRALGIFEGQSLRLLRRAPFGGPYHVRVGGAEGALGEFAIDPSLASGITLEARASVTP